MITARLMMRPFTLADADDLFNARGDPEAMRHWDWPHDTGIEQTRHVAEAMLADMSLQESLYWTARTFDGAFAGIFDLSELTGQSADLGFLVPRPMWGMGYGAEGAAAVIAAAWKTGLSTIGARIHEANTRSAALLIRLGFSEIGRVPREVRPGLIIICRQFQLSRAGA